MSDVQPPARTGRPRDEEKRKAIVSCARSLFLEHAYEEVTIDAVAAKAGVSKVTIYNQFKDKETLFETVINAIMEEVTGDSVWEETPLPLEARLNQIGMVFLSNALGPYGRMMIRTLAFVQGNRELARRLHAEAPGRAYNAVTTVVERAIGNGLLKADSACQAAEDLISLWEGGLMLQTAIGLLAEPVTEVEIDRRVRRGTDVFLRAYGTGRMELAPPLP